MGLVVGFAAVEFAELVDSAAFALVGWSSHRCFNLEQQSLCQKILLQRLLNGLASKRIPVGYIC